MTGNGFIFANAVTDNVQGAAQAEYAWSQGYKNAYLLRSPDIEYTQMPLYFAEAFKKLGGTVVGESIYALSQPDFSAEVTKIKQLSPQPDVIVTSAFEPDFPAFIRQLRGAGVTIPVVCRRRHRLADHLRASATWSKASSSPRPVSPSRAARWRPTRRSTQAKFGKAPESIMDALGYDLAKIIEAAVTKADSVEPAKMREALANLENVQGATAIISYKGGNGTPTRPVNVIRIEGGKRVLVSATRRTRRSCRRRASTSTPPVKQHGAYAVGQRPGCPLRRHPGGARRRSRGEGGRDRRPARRQRRRQVHDAQRHRRAGAAARARSVSPGSRSPAATPRTSCARGITLVPEGRRVFPP